MVVWLYLRNLTLTRLLSLVERGRRGILYIFISRRVLMAEVSGGRARGRPRLGWMDGVKVALGNRGMTVEAARKTGKSGEPWYICN